MHLLTSRTESASLPEAVLRTHHTIMRIPRLFRRPGLATIVVAAGCLGDGPELPGGPPFTDEHIIFQLKPSMLGYFFVDTSRVGSVQLNLTLRWLPDTSFTGFNCIGFLPRSDTDTIGDFAFYFIGPNQGLLERTSNGVTDTVVGNFLTGLEGTRGTYAVNSANEVTLFWSDADGLARYFDPVAQLSFIGDTLRSVAEISHKADSIHASWNVTWIRDTCTSPI